MPNPDWAATAGAAAGLERFQRRNFLHLYGDAFWAGIGYGTVLTFPSIYAARLGAAEWQLGLLSAMPPITILLLAAPAARWLEGRPVIPTLARTFFVQRLMYFALIPLPWLLSPAGQIGGILLVHFVVALTSAMGHVAWGTMLGAVLLPQSRARVLGWRGTLIALNAAIVLLICGRLLTEVSFPLNYQVVFGVGAVSMLMTSYHVSRLQLAPGAAPAVATSTSRARRPVWRLDLLRGPFGRLLAAYFLFYTFQAFTVPLYPLLYVRELRLADQWVSTATMLNYATVLATSLLLGQLGARTRHRAALISLATLFGGSPLLMAMARGADGLLWTGALLNGLGLTLAWTILIDRLLERSPADDRPGHMALHAMTWQLAWLAGSALGPVSSAGLGLRPALICASAGLLLAAGLLWRWA